ncbi:hypothetical protein [Gluconacetobacter dulcium]|uniref:hypothetical protein n=1 Tax=Gluconacetobacter dulcium TaxID=2729096 RepID=UPI001FE520CE|nr:hypothetical protein [Gluconacetobacter dulcium]
MRTFARAGLTILILASSVTPEVVRADDTPAGCEALVQAAATGIAADLKADDATIHQPQSVTKFTCLGNFFNGIGLDVLTNGINIASIAQAAMGKVCSELTSEWESLQGAAQCGLSVTGLDTNFNLGLGAGSFCPTINVGGGGDNLLNAGMNASGNVSWDVSGRTQLPDGYSLALIGSSTGYSTVEQ